MDSESSKPDWQLTPEEADRLPPAPNLKSTKRVLQRSERQVLKSVGNISPAEDRRYTKVPRWMVINPTPYEYYLVWKHLAFTVGFGVLGAFFILVPLVISLTTSILESEWAPLFQMSQIVLLVIGTACLFVAAPDFRPARYPEQLLDVEISEEEREALSNDHKYFKGKRGF